LKKYPFGCFGPRRLQKIDAMAKIFTQSFKTPYGELLIGDFEDALCLLDWKYRRMRLAIDRRIKTGLAAEYQEQETALIRKVKEQLGEYFRKERTEFDIPLKFVGTAFQQSVWQELIKIPYGKTETYLGLSQKLNNEKAIRAVASANGANAISILVPCHRIIGSDGKLVGYAGGLRAKEKLLTLEGSQKQLKLF